MYSFFTRGAVNVGIQFPGLNVGGSFARAEHTNRSKGFQFKETRIAITRTRTAKVAISGLWIVGRAFDEKCTALPVGKPAARIGESHLERRLHLGTEKYEAISKSQLSRCNV